MLAFLSCSLFPTWADSPLFLSLSVSSWRGFSFSFAVLTARFPVWRSCSKRWCWRAAFLLMASPSALWRAFCGGIPLLHPSLWGFPSPQRLAFSPMSPLLFVFVFSLNFLLSMTEIVQNVAFLWVMKKNPRGIFSMIVQNVAFLFFSWRLFPPEFPSFAPIFP